MIVTEKIRLNDCRVKSKYRIAFYVFFNEPSQASVPLESFGILEFFSGIKKKTQSFLKLSLPSPDIYNLYFTLLKEIRLHPGLGSAGFYFVKFIHYKKTFRMTSEGKAIK